MGAVWPPGKRRRSTTAHPCGFGSSSAAGSSSGFLLSVAPSWDASACSRALSSSAAASRGVSSVRSFANCTRSVRGTEYLPDSREETSSCEMVKSRSPCTTLPSSGPSCERMGAASRAVSSFSSSVPDWTSSPRTALRARSAKAPPTRRDSSILVSARAVSNPLLSKSRNRWSCGDGGNLTGMASLTGLLLKDMRTHPAYRCSTPRRECSSAPQEWPTPKTGRLVPPTGSRPRAASSAHAESNAAAAPRAVES
mmetsp:Transcript_28198/g.84173  ORF Transcript_28198/g.84173 Transcript_28198/m.84173 type:complete len:253 (+) Transcript_28198:712-1470(+)